MLAREIFNFKSTYNADDCQWNDWTVGTCSETCGDGMRTNTRTEKVSTAYGGEECNGPASIQETCNIQLCPGKKYFFSYMLSLVLYIKILSELY